MPDESQIQGQSRSESPPPPHDIMNEGRPQSPVRPRSFGLSEPDTQSPPPDLMNLTSPSNPESSPEILGKGSDLQACQSDSMQNNNLLEENKANSTSVSVKDASSFPSSSSSPSSFFSSPSSSSSSSGSSSLPSSASLSSSRKSLKMSLKTHSKNPNKLLGTAEDRAEREGWMYKHQSGRFSSSMKRRYFKVQRVAAFSVRLVCLKQACDPVFSALSILFLNKNSAVDVIPDGTRDLKGQPLFGFSLLGSKRRSILTPMDESSSQAASGTKDKNSETIYLYTASEQDRTDWINALTAVVASFFTAEASPVASDQPLLGRNASGSGPIQNHPSTPGSFESHATTGTRDTLLEGVCYKLTKYRKLYKQRHLKLTRDTLSYFTEKGRKGVIELLPSHTLSLVEKSKHLMAIKDGKDRSLCLLVLTKRAASGASGASGGGVAGGAGVEGGGGSGDAGGGMVHSGGASGGHDLVLGFETEEARAKWVQALTTSLTRIKAVARLVTAQSGSSLTGQWMNFPCHVLLGGFLSFHQSMRNKWKRKYFSVCVYPCQIVRSRLPHAGPESAKSILGCHSRGQNEQALTKGKRVKESGGFVFSIAFANGKRGFYSAESAAKREQWVKVLNMLGQAQVSGAYAIAETSSGDGQMASEEAQDMTRGGVHWEGWMVVAALDGRGGVETKSRWVVITDTQLKCFKEKLERENKQPVLCIELRKATAICPPTPPAPNSSTPPAARPLGSPNRYVSNISICAGLEGKDGEGEEAAPEEQKLEGSNSRFEELPSRCPSSRPAAAASNVSPTTSSVMTQIGSPSSSSWLEGQAATRGLGDAGSGEHGVAAVVTGEYDEERVPNSRNPPLALPVAAETLVANTCPSQSTPDSHSNLGEETNTDSNNNNPSITSPSLLLLPPAPLSQDASDYDSDDAVVGPLAHVAPFPSPHAPSSSSSPGSPLNITAPEFCYLQQASPVPCQAFLDSSSSSSSSSLPPSSTPSQPRDVGRMDEASRFFYASLAKARFPPPFSFLLSQSVSQREEGSRGIGVSAGGGEGGGGGGGKCWVFSLEEAYGTTALLGGADTEVTGQARPGGGELDNAWSSSSSVGRRREAGGVNRRKLRQWNNAMSECLDALREQLKWARLEGNMRVPAKQLLQEVEVGDLFLFHNSTLLTKVQRKFTQSKWDHVAMVVRCPIHSKSASSLSLLQTTSSNGMTVTPLSAALESWIGHSKNKQFRVALRKLRFANVGDGQAHMKRILDPFDKFLDQNLGSKYSVLGFLKRGKPKSSKESLKSSSNSASTSSVAGTGSSQTGRTYFCSELVATALQVMEMLPDDFPAAATLPGNFAGEGNPVFLSQGFHLGPLLDVNFKA